jgi:DNA-binding NarL/FixJ family response regulator
MIRVVLADDHPIFLEGIATVLGARTDVEVAATAMTGAEALAAVAEHEPDVVIVDVDMPDRDGISVAGEIAVKHPSTRIVMLTATKEHDDVVAAIRAGADAYFLKTMPVQELGDRLFAIVAGTRMLSDELVDAVFAGLRAGSGRAAPVEELTPREVDVLRLAGAGLTNQQIASQLQLSPQTVKNHLSNAYQKLNEHSRIKAVRRAQQEHLL